MNQDKKIPVTILTGFLGAGKTTLLNYLIEKNPNQRFAIIENEFGDIGIDNDLVIGADEGLFEMSNGCICCTLNDELIEVLLKLLRSEKQFDHLIIETTGMAEPDGVAAAFVADPAIQSMFELDAVVCVADANHIEDLVEEREEANKQVAFADYILLNKKSDVDTTQLPKIEALLKHINPFATIEYCDKSATQKDVLHLGAYQNRNVEEGIHDLHKHKHDHDHHHHEHHDHSHHHHHDHDHKHHHHDVTSHSFIFKEPFEFLKFMHWSNVLLRFQGKRIYRIKGILNFKDHEEKMIFQSVKDQAAFQKGDEWKDDEERVSKIVFIGKGIREDKFEQALRTCLA